MFLKYRLDAVAAGNFRHPPCAGSTWFPWDDLINAIHGGLINQQRNGDSFKKWRCNIGEIPIVMSKRG